MRIWNLRSIASVLAVALLGNSVAMAALKSVDPVKLKRTLMKRGIGMGFKVKELDGTRVTGILTAINGDTFEISAKGTTQAVSIPYAQVAAVHNDGDGRGSGTSTATKIVGGFGIGVAAIAIVFVVIGMYALHGG